MIGGLVKDQQRRRRPPTQHASKARTKHLPAAQASDHLQGSISAKHESGHGRHLARPLLLPPERGGEVSGTRAGASGYALNFRRYMPDSRFIVARSAWTFCVSSGVNAEICAVHSSRLTGMHWAIGVPFGNTPRKPVLCQCAGKWIQLSR